MTLQKILTHSRTIITIGIIIIASYFLVFSLMSAKKVLVPVITALVLALLVTPLSRKMEMAGFHKLLATSLNVILVLVVFLGITAVVSFQVRIFVKDSEKMEERLMPHLERLESFVLRHTPLERGKLEEFKDDYGLDGEENREEEMASQEDNQQKAVSILGAFFGFAADFLLIFVYLFFFIHFRRKFYSFILKLFSKDNKEEVSEVVVKSVQVVQHYIYGRLLLMVILIVSYSLGMWLSGAQNFIFISIIAALLSLIPFIGNMIGYVLAMFIGLLTAGGLSTLVGITVTFIIVQFLDSYIFQPLILGEKVNVHPFFIILAVIIGNAIWGTIGMALSIPIVAIVTIFLRHIPDLEAFAYLLSNEEEEP